MMAAGAAIPGAARAQVDGPGHGHAHQAIPSDLTLRVKSLESLLVEKGLVDRAALDALVDMFEHKVGPRNGARVVARAWVDGAYKRVCCRTLIARSPSSVTAASRANTWSSSRHAAVHNVVVCTLCSCLPMAGARSAADVVQVGTLPFAISDRSTRRAARIRARAAE